MSISRLRVLSLPYRPKVCFAPMMLTCPVSRLMSPIVSHVSSMGLVPRSFIMLRTRAKSGFALAMQFSIRCSVGIFGGFSYRL